MRVNQRQKWMVVLRTLEKSEGSMLIHNEAKAAFILHPRTASHAIAEVLQGIGFTYSGTHHIIDSGWVKIAKSVACVVRNPFDVLVSWYYYQGNGKTFNEYLKDWPNQWALNGMFYGLKFCDFVIHYENLDSELNEWLQMVGLRPVTLPKVNITKSRQPWERMFMDHEMSIKICDLTPRIGRFHL